MKNIQLFEEYKILSSVTKPSISYTIDWSLYEGEFEYDYLTEELKIIFTDHADKQAFNYKIDPKEIEELLGSISNYIINAYNKYPDNYDSKVEVTMSIRDRTKKIPFEIITIVEGGNEKNVKKEEIALTGNVFSQSKIKKIESEIERGMHQEISIGSTGKETPNTNSETIKLLQKKEQETGLALEPKDYVFKVITTRRKKDFIPNSAGQVVFDILPDKVIKHNGDELRQKMMRF